MPSKISQSRLFFYDNAEAGVRAWEMETAGVSQFCFQVTGKELVQVDGKDAPALLEALAQYVGASR